MLTFPTALFPPQSQIWRIAAASISGGASLSGVTQYGNFSGGGHWEAELDKAARILSQAMKHAYELEVPLVVGVEAGRNWADLERVAT